jgi:tRNA G18 (ribose-2'-O)-methylase SpoU
MSAETKQLCDMVLSIPIHERTESLNAAAAAAVVMYQWSSKHPESLT